MMEKGLYISGRREVRGKQRVLLGKLAVAHARPSRLINSWRLLPLKAACLEGEHGQKARGQESNARRFGHGRKAAA